MVARDGVVVFVVGEFGMAIYGASHDAGGAIVEDDCLAFGSALGNGEGDFGCHGRQIYFGLSANLCLRIGTGAMFVN
jgi:hypothetical protein